MGLENQTLQSLEQIRPETYLELLLFLHRLEISGLCLLVVQGLLNDVRERRLAKFRQNIARFRLYRLRFLQENTRFAAFFKIYQIL